MGEPFENLLEINRNQNGDYYFIYSVPNVRNNINTKAKARNELLIVGVPKKKLINYLRSALKVDKNLRPEQLKEVLNNGGTK